MINEILKAIYAVDGNTEVKTLKITSVGDKSIIEVTFGKAEPLIEIKEDTSPSIKERVKELMKGIPKICLNMSCNKPQCKESTRYCKEHFNPVPEEEETVEKKVFEFDGVTIQGETEKKVECLVCNELTSDQSEYCSEECSDKDIYVPKKEEAKENGVTCAYKSCNKQVEPAWSVSEIYCSPICSQLSTTNKDTCICEELTKMAGIRMAHCQWSGHFEETVEPWYRCVDCNELLPIGSEPNTTCSKCTKTPEKEEVKQAKCKKATCIEIPAIDSRYCPDHGLRRKKKKPIKPNKCKHCDSDYYKTIYPGFCSGPCKTTYKEENNGC